MDVRLAVSLIEHTSTKFSKAAPLLLLFADAGAENAGLGLSSPVKNFSALDLSTKRWVRSGARERQDRVWTVPQLSVLLILEDPLALARDVEGVGGVAGMEFGDGGGNGWNSR